MRRKPHKKYSREFKLDTIRLAQVGDKAASQIARELGIQKTTGYLSRIVFSAELRGR